MDAHTRVKTILGCEAAKDRPAFAQFLALEKPDISAAEAEEILKASPVEHKAGNQAATFYGRVKQSGGNPQVSHAATPDEGKPLTAAQANIERQKARFANPSKR